MQEPYPPFAKSDKPSLSFQDFEVFLKTYKDLKKDLKEDFKNKNKLPYYQKLLDTLIDLIEKFQKKDLKKEEKFRLFRCCSLMNGRERDIFTFRVNYKDEVKGLKKKLLCYFNKKGINGFVKTISKHTSNEMKFKTIEIRIITDQHKNFFEFFKNLREWIIKKIVGKVLIPGLLKNKDDKKNNFPTFSEFHFACNSDFSVFQRFFIGKTDNCESDGSGEDGCGEKDFFKQQEVIENFEEKGEKRDKLDRLSQSNIDSDFVDELFFSTMRSQEIINEQEKKIQNQEKKIQNQGKEIQNLKKNQKEIIEELRSELRSEFLIMLEENEKLRKQKLDSPTNDTTNDTT